MYEVVRMYDVHVGGVMATTNLKYCDENCCHKQLGGLSFQSFVVKLGWLMFYGSVFFNLNIHL